MLANKAIPATATLNQGDKTHNKIIAAKKEREYAASFLD